MKFFTLVSLFSGVVLVFLILLIINQNTLKCDTGHLVNNQTEECYYKLNTTCRENEKTDGVYCYYRPVSLFRSELFIWIMIITGLSVLALIIYNFVSKGKVTPGLYPMLKQEEEVEIDKAKKAIELDIAKEHGIYINDNNVQEGVISWYLQRRPYYRTLTGEKFYMGMIEINGAENVNANGIYTITFPLSRGLKGVLNSYRIEHLFLEQYKYSQQFPEVIPKKKEDIILKLLERTESPEEIKDLQNKLLMKELQSTQSSSTQQHPLNEIQMFSPEERALMLEQGQDFNVPMKRKVKTKREREIERQRRLKRGY